MTPLRPSRRHAFMYRTPRLKFRLTRKMPPAPTAATPSCACPAILARRALCQRAPPVLRRSPPPSRRAHPPRAIHAGAVAPVKLDAPARSSSSCYQTGRDQLSRACYSTCAGAHNTQVHHCFANYSRAPRRAKPICIRSLPIKSSPAAQD
ncbi:hypothetical protein B0J12DRAFT_272715 [Macrophomina phaseolina]|uniref:Uncharacterized protein n=1 Tax=Macrophomina phaseolina TaxID=35725 RepID=A0ABQ8G0K9_9PEZI|nr:hypothetical protein B0J12DRAFT_272715 [Macrophomina phaseolina]